jgi:hypothetical protein
VARVVNGEPGIVAFRDGAVFAVLALTVRRGLITRLYAQADPRKLAQVRRVLDEVHSSGGRPALSRRPNARPARDSDAE